MGKVESNIEKSENAIYKQVKIANGNLINNSVQLLIENDLIAYFALDKGGCLIDLNTKLATLLGYTKEELVNKKVTELLLQGDQSEIFWAFPKSSLRDQEIDIVQTFIHKNGTKVHGQLNGSLFDCFEIHEICSIIVFTDITNKVNYNESLINQNENLRLKDELINTKELELKKQNSELKKLNETLKEQNLSFEKLQSQVIENELRLNLAFNSVNDGVWDWNLKSNEIYFSDRFFNMLGYDAYEFPQTITTWKSLIHHEDSTNIQQIFEKIISGTLSDFSFEYRLRSKNEQYKWILIRGKLVAFDDRGKPLRLLGTHVDITQQKETEIILKMKETDLKKQNEELALINKKLAESHQNSIIINKQVQEKQALINSIFKSVPATIGLISNHIIQYVNDYTVLMTGYDLDELIGKNALILFQSEAEYSRVEENLYQEEISDHTKSISTVWKMKNGTLIDVYITATLVDIDQSTPTYSFSALDVTNQRIYEEELISARDQAEKAERLKTVFLSNMSHELRTPMNGIIGFAELIQSQVNPTKRDEYLKVIVTSAKQLLHIISDIIDISKIETGEIEVFETSISLNRLFKELHDFYKTQLSLANKSIVEIGFDVDFPKDEDVVLVDEIKLRQILNNMLSNAVKFTEVGHIKFGCSIDSDYVKFFVNDSGIGIISEDQDAIFECFRQTESPTQMKNGGNGLGLAISKGFIHHMGGKIWVESVLGEGTTFYFTVPYKPKIMIDSDEITNEPEPTKVWQDFHLLIVEDDMMCFDLMYEMLIDTGIKISHATTGLEAVKICRKENTIDLVLMDMRLPEMDGYEATQRIKEFKPNLKIIAQTAHALSEDRKNCIAAGCDDYITKPIVQVLLFEKISQYLYSK